MHYNAVLINVKYTSEKMKQIDVFLHHSHQQEHFPRNPEAKGWEEVRWSYGACVFSQLKKELEIILFSLY